MENDTGRWKVDKGGKGAEGKREESTQRLVAETERRENGARYVDGSIKVPAKEIRKWFCCVIGNG